MTERKHSVHSSLLHEQAWLQLPAYVNGSLDADSARSMKAHLGQCLVCRREQRRLLALVQALVLPEQDYAVQRGYSRLAQEIQRAETPRKNLGALLGRIFGSLEPAPLLLGGAVLVFSSLMTAGIVLTGVESRDHRAQAFQTLGARPVATPAISRPLLRVVLREPRLGQTNLDAWLERHGAQVVEGPSTIGVLTVEIGAQQRSLSDTLVQIRDDPETLFVEALDPLGDRPDRIR